MENRFVVAKRGGRGGMDWEFGLADANYYVKNGLTTRPDWIVCARAQSLSRV